MAFEWSRLGGLLVVPAFNAGSATSSAAIDSAFVFETSGDAYCIRFTAPVAQSAATLTIYLYCTAVTGTPDFQVEVRDGYNGSGDVDRPATGGSNLASGSSTLTLGAGDVNTWVALTCTVSLTVGLTYWVIVKNTHGTPASNHATFQYRGAMDAFVEPAAGVGGFQSGFTTSGFTTDPTVNTANGVGVSVLKFGDGSLIGFPWVASAAHASNTNFRGIRIQFDANAVVSGVVTAGGTSALSGAGIFATGGSTIASSAGDGAVESLSQTYRFAPATLTGGTSYDIVTSFASNSSSGTIYNMGEAEADVPADVKACRPAWLVGYVDGTIGSFTPDTSRVIGVSFVLDNFPASGGGSTVIVIDD